MARVAGRGRGGDEQREPLKCPKCGAQMGKVTVQSVVIDRCTSCRGLWFDALEHERLSEIEGSEDVDAPQGSPATGAAAAPGAPTPSGIGDAKMQCPVCHTRMIRMADRRQPHIKYESCTVCHGVFFDAGEFRDFKEKTVVEWFKGLRRGR